MSLTNEYTDNIFMDESSILDAHLRLLFSAFHYETPCISSNLKKISYNIRFLILDFVVGHSSKTLIQYFIPQTFTLLEKGVLRTIT